MRKPPTRLADARHRAARGSFWLNGWRRSRCRRCMTASLSMSRTVGWFRRQASTGIQRLRRQPCDPGGGASPLLALATAEEPPQGQVFGTDGALVLPAGTNSIKVSITPILPDRCRPKATSWERLPDLGHQSEGGADHGPGERPSNRRDPRTRRHRRVDDRTLCRGRMEDAQNGADRFRRPVSRGCDRLRRLHACRPGSWRPIPDGECIGIDTFGVVRRPCQLAGFLCGRGRLSRVSRAVGEPDLWTSPPPNVGEGPPLIPLAGLLLVAAIGAVLAFRLRGRTGAPRIGALTRGGGSSAPDDLILHGAAVGLIIPGVSARPSTCPGQAGKVRVASPRVSRWRAPTRFEINRARVLEARIAQTRRPGRAARHTHRGR